MQFAPPVVCLPRGRWSTGVAAEDVRELLSVVWGPAFAGEAVATPPIRSKVTVPLTIGIIFVSLVTAAPSAEPVYKAGQQARPQNRTEPSD